MRWAGHVARMGEERKVYRFWWESLKERATRKIEVFWEVRIRTDLKELG
jgi:hypothetical protein